MDIKIGDDRSSRSSSKGASFIGGIVFIVAGLIIRSVMGGFVEEARASENWPTGNGTITISEIISTISTDSDGKERTMYYPNISAEYTLDGNSYNTSGINVGPQSQTSSRSSVKKKTAAYPVGSSVKVYYDPEDPGYAVLEPGLTTMMKIFTLFPYIAVVVGALLLLKGLLKLLGMAAALGFLIKKKGDSPAVNTGINPVQPPQAASSPGSSQETPASGEEGAPKAKPADGEDDGFSI